MSRSWRVKLLPRTLCYARYNLHIYLELSHGRECTDNVYCLKREFFFYNLYLVDFYLYNFCCILYKQITSFTTDCTVVKTHYTSVITPQTFATGLSTSSMEKIKCSAVKVVTPRVKNEEMGSLSLVSKPFRGSCAAAFFSLSPPPHQNQWIPKFILVRG